MPEYSLEDLNKKLAGYLDFELSDAPTTDINTALQISEFMESKGYGFRLKDLCPKSLTESSWRAIFTHGDTEFTAENTESAIAVCSAALAALEAAQA